MHVVSSDVEEPEVAARARREDPLLREASEVVEDEALQVLRGDPVVVCHAHPLPIAARPARRASPRAPIVASGAPVAARHAR